MNKETTYLYSYDISNKIKNEYSHLVISKVHWKLSEDGLQVKPIIVFGLCLIAQVVSLEDRKQAQRWHQCYLLERQVV